MSKLPDRSNRAQPHFHVKHLGRTSTQRCMETLDQNIADPALESYVIDYAYQPMVMGTDFVCPDTSMNGESL
jgi:hypothetical protein